MTVGATLTRNWRQIIRGAAAAERSTPSSSRCGTATPTRSAVAIPKNLPRRVSGYNLDDLLPEKGFHVARALSGTEGTCVTVLEASLHLVHSPAVKSLLVLGYPDVYSARRSRHRDHAVRADGPGGAR